MEGALSGQHLVQHGAQSEDVGAVVGGLSSHLLWRHVTNCSQYVTRISSLLHGYSGAVSSCGLDLRQLGQAEVEDFYPSIPGDEQVFRFEVAMNDSFVVRCRQAVRDLHSAVNRPTQRHRPPPETLAQGIAFH